MINTTKNILIAFEEYLPTAPLPSRTREGAAEKTIRGYVHDVNGCLQWLKQSEGEALTVEFVRKDPFSLNKKTIQDYVNYLVRSVAIATVLRNVSSQFILDFTPKVISYARSAHWSKTLPQT